MKKILIFSHAMELGGAERALLGLLESIDYSCCDVDLFLMHHSGELMKYIPKQVRLLHEIPQYASLAVPINDVIKKGQFGVILGRSLGKVLARLKEKQMKYVGGSDIELEYSHKYTCWTMPMMSSKEYDLAISFLTPHYFVQRKVKARKKIAWIHTDYSKVQIDIESELRMWEKYNHIISISQAVTKSFLDVFPSLADKIIEINNIIPTKCISTQIKETSIVDEMRSEGKIQLLSIGRFCKAKNFDNIPEICKIIIESGLDIKWYIIGFGSDEQLIRRRINDANMQERVIILGKKENPYPYIMNCDLYVQPSRYEGNSVTVHEAQLLKKPVLITDYATAKSQLNDGYDGIIVPMNNEACARGIIALLNNPIKMEALSRACAENDYSNKKEVSKIMMLME